MSALRQVEQNGTYFNCRFDHEMIVNLAKVSTENGEAIRTLTASIQTLTHYHREMNRWLLIVICAIALGTKFVELAQDIWVSK